MEDEPELPLKVLLTPYDHIEDYSASGKFTNEVKHARLGEKVKDSEFDIVGMWEE